jgi:hypothetical protein
MFTQPSAFKTYKRLDHFLKLYKFLYIKCHMPSNQMLRIQMLTLVRKHVIHLTLKVEYLNVEGLAKEPLFTVVEIHC